LTSSGHPGFTGSALIAALIPTIPFLAAMLGLFGSRRLPGGPAGPAVLGTATATVLSVVLLLSTHAGTLIEHVARLTPTGGLVITVGTRVDPLAAVTAVMVCVVALLVQVYSTGYLRGDRRYGAYAAEVSLFTAAMLTVVLAADLIMLLVGWEVMGLCSYLLIGHYREQPTASAAAIKAFLTTRIGDVGFLFGIFTLGVAAGSFRISTVLAAPLGHRTVVVATLLLTCGVVGKSAQFPLHTWLPDAMAGPTPISALIHAATMVAAGVYVIARLFPLFLASPTTLDVLAVIAAITMVLGALAALAQDDLKRVLAYSTVSQLAYMVGGLAVGGYAAGVLHLLTHAAFKALLFLCAGAVIYAVGTNLMSEMGGLRHRLPLTFACSTVGLIALAGLPPFAGFFSKDAILGAAYHRGGFAGWLVLIAGLLTVLLTAAYVTRLWLRTFFGPLAPAAVSAPPAVMGVPLLLLAVPAALLGFAGPAVADYLGVPRQGDVGVFAHTPLSLHVPQSSLGGQSVRPELGTAVATTALALLGATAVFALWRRNPARDPVTLLAARPRRALERAFYVDELYDAALVRPLPRLARLVLRFDDVAVDGAVDGTGRVARWLGGGLRLLQNGNVQLYATALLAGVVALTVAVAVLA
jgi:NADH-quinone oxidoreductase subunit L